MPRQLTDHPEAYRRGGVGSRGDRERSNMPKGSPELTSARREEIVSACEKLYQTMSFKDITIRDIGNATSFGRTSIYNYFQTKEEIFLALLQREYEAWTEDLTQLAAAPDSCGSLAAGLAETLSRRELLLKIMSMNHFEMEENSREERLVEFKTAYGASMQAVLRCLDVFCPEMGEREKREFLYIFFPFLYGVYPYAEISAKQRRALETARIPFVYQSVYEMIYTFLQKVLGPEKSAVPLDGKRRGTMENRA